MKCNSPVDFLPGRGFVAAKRIRLFVLSRRQLFFNSYFCKALPCFFILLKYNKFERCDLPINTAKDNK